MQSLQRSYAISKERIENIISKGSLSIIYDEDKVKELENIEELSGKEQKNEAVTKGIDADVEMTESGVEWIGQMLAHWK